MSIRAGWSNFRFLIIVGAGITCMVVLSIVLTIWWLRAEAIADASRDSKNLATVLADQIENSVQTLDLVLGDIKTVLERRRSTAPNDFGRLLRSEDTYQLLMERLSHLPAVERILLVDKDGQVATTTIQHPSAKLDVSDRDYFQYLKNNNNKNIFIGQVYGDRRLGTQLVVFGRRFNGANNEFNGLVLVTIKFSHFEQIYKSIASIPGQNFLLLQRDGTVIVRYPDAVVRSGEKVPSESSWYRMVSQGGGEYLAPGVFDGEARLIAVHPLRDYPLVINVGISETAALATWRIQATTLGIGTLLLIFSIGFLFKALSKQFLRIATSEATVDAALNNMSQGLVMFGSSNRLIVCNQRYLEMYGLSPEAVRPGRTLQEVIDCRIAAGNFFLDGAEQSLADFRVSGRKNTIYRKTMKLSDKRTIQIVNRPVPGGGWVATHEDVTGKANAENTIKLQKQQLNATLENVSQGVCMFDAAQQLIFCNKQYADMYELNDEQTKPGTSLRQILEYRIATGNAPDDHQGYINDRLNEVTANKPYQTINRMHDGRRVSVVHRPMANGGWVATHEDVTDAIRREESFRLLFDGNPVPMWVSNRESLRFLAVNEAAIKHYGYSREQFLAMTVLDLQPFKDREQFEKYYQSRPENQLVENIAQHLKADGTTIDVCVYSRTLAYDGNIARMAAVHDITERNRAEHELHRTNDKFVKQNIQFEAALNNMAQGLLMFDPDGKLAVSNRRFAELFEVPWEKWASSALGMTVPQTLQFAHELNETVTDTNTSEILAAVKATLIDHTVHGVIVERTNGRVFDASMAPKPNGGFVVTFDDITVRRRDDEKISHMAHYDRLTDLPNRASFDETLEATINRAATTGERFAVLSIDLDHFKEANDTYGHLIGDRLLREIAERLKAAAGGAFLARLGGDEFVVIATTGEQPAAAAVLANRLLAVFADDFEAEGHCLKLGMSMGVAIYPTDGVDAKILMTSADAALYRAKAEFRGTTLFFVPEMSARLHERYALQEDLRLAIDRGELSLHYQPQVKMSGETIGFEALARWQCPKRGMVPPGTFIPIAEESSLIMSVGEWVLREACREAASWPQPLTIAVNISPIQFRHGELPMLVHLILLETGLAPGRLELEITESVMINDFSHAVSILNRLKSLGVKIAMDDFGTGYSSLSYLQSFRCDKIKIDRAFICDLESNYHSRAIVRAVIGLGQSLSLPILAEGVETEAQHAYLVQEGCDEVQGYLTGRPLPIADYAELVGYQASTQNIHAVAE